MKFPAKLLSQRNLAVTAFLVLLSALSWSCSTTPAAPAYRSGSLRISSVPNPFTAQLAALEAPKIEEEVNRAFMADGSFAPGTGLILSLELTSFQAPRPVGTQRLPDRLGTNYSFLPGIMVVAVRWFDSREKKLEEVEFAQEIIPLPGEVSHNTSVNRAIRDISQRIMVYTTERYFASTSAGKPPAS